MKSGTHKVRLGKVGIKCLSVALDWKRLKAKGIRATLEPRGRALHWVPEATHHNQLGRRYLASTRGDYFTLHHWS